MRALVLRNSIALHKQISTFREDRHPVRKMVIKNVLKAGNVRFFIGNQQPATSLHRRKKAFKKVKSNRLIQHMQRPVDQHDVEVLFRCIVLQISDNTSDRQIFPQGVGTKLLDTA